LWEGYADINNLKPTGIGGAGLQPAPAFAGLIGLAAANYPNRLP